MDPPGAVSGSTGRWIDGEEHFSSILHLPPLAFSSRAFLQDYELHTQTYCVYRADSPSLVQEARGETKSSRAGPVRPHPGFFEKGPLEDSV